MVGVAQKALEAMQAIARELRRIADALEGRADTIERKRQA